MKRMNLFFHRICQKFEISAFLIDCVHNSSLCAFCRCNRCNVRNLWKAFKKNRLCINVYFTQLTLHIRRPLWSMRHMWLYNVRPYVCISSLCKYGHWTLDNDNRNLVIQSALINLLRISMRRDESHFRLLCYFHHLLVVAAVSSIIFFFIWHDTPDTGHSFLMGFFYAKINDR